MFFEREFPKMMCLELEPYCRRPFQARSQLPCRNILNHQMKCRKFPKKTDYIFDSTVLTDSTWERHLSLGYPTKPEDLKVDIVGEKLTISGISEMKKSKDGFNVTSTHRWSRDLQIPRGITDVKVTITDINLKITGKK